MKLHRYCITVFCFVACTSKAPLTPIADPSADQPTASRVIAVLDGRRITEGDVRTNSLSALIIDSLFDRYRSQHGIEATQSEVDSCFRTIFRADLDPAADLDIQAGDEEAVEYATNLVLNWKTDRQMYADYGGVVIFQQMNPTEPVGAYLAFLREQGSAGTFLIYDEEQAREFWDYFVSDPGPWRVSPEDVDFSRPWWDRVRDLRSKAGK
jgi:hypothetical protein